MKRIIEGDTVIVTTGKSKGHIGKVIGVVDDTIVVEGANIIKKHVKPNPQKQQSGGIISREAPFNVSNVAKYNPVLKRADKVGFKYLEDEGNRRKVRYFKSNNEVIDYASN